MTIIPQDDTPQKQCSNPDCQQWFPATPEFFHRDKRAKSGLCLYCKQCQHQSYVEHRSERLMKSRQNYTKHQEERREYQRQRYAENKEELLRKQHQYWIEHKEAHQNRTRQYHIEHREELLLRHRLYWVEHREELREKQRQYYVEHREELIQKQHQYYVEHKENHIQYRTAHREERREWHKRYLQTEHGQMIKRILNHKRRAQKKAIEGTLTSVQIQEKLKAQHYRCYYALCSHAKFEKIKGQYVFHLEHTIPLSRTEANPRHDINYVVLACPSCNFKKNNKLPHEFFEGGRLF